MRYRKTYIIKDSYETISNKPSDNEKSNFWGDSSKV